MYRYFDTKGATRHPRRSEVVHLAREAGVLTGLFLDANVVLDLASLGKAGSSGRKPVLQFARRIEASGADVFPGFGLIELSLDRRTWAVDPGRLESLERNYSLAVDSVPGRADQRPPEVITQGLEPVDGAVFKPWVPLLRVFYASLLKVALLSESGLGRSVAIRNIETFLDWTSGELDCVSALSLQVALAILGGDSVSRKLIGAGRNDRSLKAVWSGAWDLFHVFQIQQVSLFGLDDELVYPIFVTGDRACFEIFSRSRLIGAIRFDPDNSPLMMEVSSDYPHFAESQNDLHELLKKVTLTRVPKLVEGKRGDPEHVASVIDGLETEWLAAHRD